MATWVRFLVQNSGRLSKIAREKEFAMLADGGIAEFIGKFSGAVGHGFV